MRPIRVLTWHIHGNYLLYLSRANVEFYLPVKPGRARATAAGARPSRSPTASATCRPRRCATSTSTASSSRRGRTTRSTSTRSSRDEQRRLPRIYLEHDPPRTHPTDTRHWFDDPDALLVHVTPFNALMWDSGRTPTRVIEHGVFVPEGVRYTGEIGRGIVVINHLRVARPAARGRRLRAGPRARSRSTWWGWTPSRWAGSARSSRMELRGVRGAVSLLLQPDPLDEPRPGRHRGDDARHADRRPGDDRDGHGDRERRLRLRRHRRRPA